MNLELTEVFEKIFHAPAKIIISAPGRVNIIGEHTDYNDGFVLPMAIDRAVHIALRPRLDDRILIHSLEYKEKIEFSLSKLEHGGPSWGEYIKGVAWVLGQEGISLSGWEGVMTGDVPRGAGLSSSAAVEIAAGLAFMEIAGENLDPIALALFGQKAENQWVGVRCGIMDQMASSASRSGHALFLDCRSLAIEHIPLPYGVKVAILDTNTRRGLMESAYNERRIQCETAAKIFGVKALRDVDSKSFLTLASRLDEVTQRRARHVISENARVVRAVAAMRNSNPILLGELLNSSHASLRDDFEVSNHALNTIVAIACRQPGCYGARMTGAGFGGCALALIREDVSDTFKVKLAQEYELQTGLIPSIYITHPAQGACATRLTI